jgi:hypothetical protein
VRTTRRAGATNNFAKMDWLAFNAAFWGSISLWLLPRGLACVWAAVKAVAS